MSTPIGNIVFTVMVALAQVDLERERMVDPLTEPRAATGDLGGRRGGQRATRVSKELWTSRTTLYRRIKELKRADA